MTERPAPRFVAAADATPATDGPEVALVTIPSVELLEVGEDWQTSTGVFTWDVEDLQSAIESQADPAVRTPVIKLGHTDPRFDGTPAFGRILNLRLTNNDQTLVGDLVGTPAWLASVMASAFPRRSIEGFFDVTTRTGNTWPFVLTAVALLGEAYPAIDTLEDLTMLWGSQAPELVPLEDNPEDAVVASAGGLIRATKEEHLPTRRVRAAVSVDDLRRSFYESLDQTQYWWWIREIRVDPAELIVDDDNGSLYQITYTVSADDTVIFGEPVEVKIEYVEVAASRAEVPLTSEGQLVAARWGDRVAAGAPERANPEDNTTPAPSSGTVPEATTVSEEGHQVKLSDDQLRKLGLEPGASEEEQQAALDAFMTQAETPGDGGTGGEGDGGETTTPETTPETTTPETETTTPEATTPPAGVQVPEGMVLVDSAQWAEVQQGVAAAQTLMQERREATKRDLIDGAVRAGKFPVARKQHYEAMYDADPEGTAQILASLAPGLVPVTERGTAGGTDAPADETSYPESWKTAVAASRRGAGARIKVVSD